MKKAHLFYYENTLNVKLITLEEDAFSVVKGALRDYYGDSYDEKEETVTRTVLH